MVWWLAAAQGVLQIAGGIQGQQRAEEAGRRAVALIREETAEEIRRTRREFDVVFGQQQAILGVSGARTTIGTPYVQTEALRQEQSLQLAWLERAGELRARAAEASGQYVAQQQFASGVGGGLQAFGQAYQSYYAPKRDPVTGEYR